VKEIYISHPKHVPFEYNQITKNIYIGSNQCCQTHFEQSLLKKGIKADISLEKERLDAPFGVDYFLWLPVTDSKAPSQEQFLIGAKAIKNFVDSNIKVYVHCLRGHGRSPTLVAAYLILEGLKTNDAIRKIRDKRLIHLTKVQIKALKKFEKNIRK
jgi:atypical dual specificity phosphatase